MEWVLFKPSQANFQSDGLSRIETAFREQVGDRVTELMHKQTRHLANLSPHQVAQAPSGERIVLAELDNIVRQARGTTF
jgi:hypothetical protein